MGAKAYDIIDNYELTGSVIEIGSERGEGSTAYLSKASVTAGNKFYTVDFDLDLPDFAGINDFRMTGEEFFAHHFPKDEKICFAYLDGFDWIWDEGGWVPDWIPEQIARYKTYGLEMNNENSQLSHLNLTKAVVEHAADKCVILFDDTFRSAAFWNDQSIHYRDAYDGKGGTAVPLLIEQGWHEINLNLKEDVAVAFCNWT